MRLLSLLFALLSPLLLTACPDTQRGDDDDQACVPGETQECVCPASASGAQSCNEDGSGWDACDCPSDDDDAADDDDAGPNDDDAGPNDDDAGPNDDDAGPNDDDSDHGDDDDTDPPDDDDTGPPDDDDTGPPDDDDFGPPDDDDSGGPDPNDGPTPCPGGDQSICDDPTNCPLPTGCSCVDNAVMGDWFCFPSCPNGQSDCDALSMGLTCTAGACQP